MNTALSRTEELALAGVVASSEAATATQRGITKSCAAIASISETSGISAAQILLALSEGATRNGDRILYKTIGTLASYLSPWGVLVIVGLGLYQSVQTAKATASSFLNIVKKALSFTSLGTAFTAAKGVVGRFFNDEAAEADPANALMGLSTLVATEVPIFGMILRSLSETTAAPTKDGPRSWKTVTAAGGYDARLVPDEDEEDADEDTVFDADGNELDGDELSVGDIVYDEDGNAYRIADEDGNLHDIAYDIAYDED